MIKNIKINKNLLKKIKTKLLIGATILGLGLTGCGINNSNNYTSYNNYETSNSYQNSYEVELNFQNYNQTIIDNELITFYNSNGDIFNSYKINDDNSVKATIPEKDCMVSSFFLEKNVKLPTTDDEHCIIINIDYTSNTIETSLQEIKQIEKVK